MSGTIEERARGVIAEQLCIPIGDVTPEKSLEDLGADSLDTVEIVMMLEDEFRITISDEDAEAAKTVQQVIDCIIQKVPA